MPRHRPGPDDDLLPFDVAPAPHREEPVISHGGGLPVWSFAKARLIAEYLRLFILVTKHGTYIDGFAGPQANEECWSAKNVVEVEPPWLRHFHLCDANARAIAQLFELRAAHPDRDIHVYGPGDFNVLVDGIVIPDVIGETEATFCLLDQRTFECRWETVVKLAGYKERGYKIELFYFLANAWLDRALAASTTAEGRATITRWWGSDQWQQLRGAHHTTRARLVARRFQDELGYRFAVPFQIYDREEGTMVMYYMVHATDHPAAPDFMSRAYATAVRAPGPPQLLFKF
jgi:three-Cys-motif partner protein